VRWSVRYTSPKKLSIYADTEDMAVMKNKYAQLAGNEGYQKLVATCPVIAIWDDHDYGGNDVGNKYPKKEESKEVFLNFFNEPAESPRRHRKGNYTSPNHTGPNQPLCEG
jgi:alkaline phosphatase D